MPLIHGATGGDGRAISAADAAGGSAAPGAGADADDARRTPTSGSAVPRRTKANHGRALLELGCGDAPLAPDIRARGGFGGALVAIDCAPACVRRLRALQSARRDGVRYVAMDACRLAFAEVSRCFRAFFFFVFMMMMAFPGVRGGESGDDDVSYEDPRTPSLPFSRHRARDTARRSPRPPPRSRRARSTWSSTRARSTRS